MEEYAPIVLVAGLALILYYAKRERCAACPGWYTNPAE